MHSIFLANIIAFRPLGYIFFFIAMIFEGDAALFTAGFLVHAGYFDAGDMSIVVFLGVILGDLLWYGLGRQIDFQKFRLGRWLTRMAEPFDSHIVEKPLRTIFISKFTYGIHHAILVRAGTLRLHLLEFLKNDIVSTVAWMLIVGGVGYFSGVSLAALRLRHALRFIEFTLLALLVLFLTALHFIAKRSRKNL